MERLALIAIVLLQCWVWLPAQAEQRHASRKGRDWHSFCCYWASLGDCVTNAKFMLPVCQKSCGTHSCRAENYRTCKVDVSIDGCKWTNPNRTIADGQKQPSGHSPRRVSPVVQKLLAMAIPEKTALERHNDHARSLGLPAFVARKVHQQALVREEITTFSQFEELRKSSESQERSEEAKLKQRSERKKSLLESEGKSPAALSALHRNILKMKQLLALRKAVRESAATEKLRLERLRAQKALHQQKINEAVTIENSVSTTAVEVPERSGEAVLTSNGETPVPKSSDKFADREAEPELSETTETSSQQEEKQKPDNKATNPKNQETKPDKQEITAQQPESDSTEQQQGKTDDEDEPAEVKPGSHERRPRIKTTVEESFENVAVAPTRSRTALTPLQRQRNIAIQRHLARQRKLRAKALLERFQARSTTPQTPDTTAITSTAQQPTTTVVPISTTEKPDQATGEPDTEIISKEVEFRRRAVHRLRLLREKIRKMRLEARGVTVSPQLAKSLARQSTSRERVELRRKSLQQKIQEQKSQNEQGSPEQDSTEDANKKKIFNILQRLLERRRLRQEEKVRKKFLPETQLQQDGEVQQVVPASDIFNIKPLSDRSAAVASELSDELKDERIAQFIQGLGLEFQPAPGSIERPIKVTFKSEDNLPVLESDSEIRRFGSVRDLQSGASIAARERPHSIRRPHITDNSQFNILPDPLPPATSREIPIERKILQRQRTQKLRTASSTAHLHVSPSLSNKRSDSSKERIRQEFIARMRAMFQRRRAKLRARLLAQQQKS